MITVNRKPISVNDCWQGRRFKTPEYRIFIHDVLFQLKKFHIPDGPLEINFKFGTSSHGSDLDNFLKPTIDVLAAKYKFNDNRIMKLTAEKVLTKKGEEFISFEIKPIEKPHTFKPQLTQTTKM